MNRTSGPINMFVIAFAIVDLTIWARRQTRSYRFISSKKVFRQTVTCMGCLKKIINRLMNKSVKKSSRVWSRWCLSTCWMIGQTTSLSTKVVRLSTSFCEWDAKFKRKTIATHFDGKIDDDRLVQGRPRNSGPRRPPRAFFKNTTHTHTR